MFFADSSSSLLFFVEFFLLLLLLVVMSFYLKLSVATPHSVAPARGVYLFNSDLPGSSLCLLVCIRILLGGVILGFSGSSCSSGWLVSNPLRGCYMVLPMFIFFFFFFTPLLSGPYLWNRYSQRLQIECAAWSCCLILHYSLPSNSLYFFLFIYLFFFFFFPPRFCLGHISGTVTCRDSKLSVLLGPAV